MPWLLRVILVTGFCVLCARLFSADLIPPASVSVGAITVQAQPQVRLSAVHTLRIEKARAKAGWQLTAAMVNGGLTHAQSGGVIPASVRFTAIRGLYGATTSGITFSTDGSSVTSGPYNANRTYDADFQAQLTVPAFPRAGNYQGTISFIISEY